MISDNIACGLALAVAWLLGEWIAARLRSRRNINRRLRKIGEQP